MQVRICSPLFSIVLVIAFVVAVVFLREAVANYASAKHPLVTGTIVRAEQGEYILGVTRPLLVVQLEDRPETVRALLSASGTDNLPQRVSFHYSGDPSKEVFLQEENNPLWIGLAFLGAIFAWLALAKVGVVSDPVLAWLWRTLKG